MSALVIFCYWTDPCYLYNCWLICTQTHTHLLSHERAHTSTYTHVVRAHTHIDTQVRAHTHTHLQTHRVICTTAPLSCLGSLTDRVRSTSCRFLNVSDNIDGNSMMCNVLSMGETKYIGKATSEKKKKDGWLENLHVFWQLESVGRFLYFFSKFQKKKKESAPIFWCRSGYRRQTIFFFRPYPNFQTLA